MMEEEDETVPKQVYDVPENDFLSFLDRKLATYISSPLEFKMLAELQKPKNKKLFGEFTLMAFFFVEDILSDLPLSSNNPFEVLASCRTDEFCENTKQEVFLLKVFSAWFKEQIKTINEMNFDSQEAREHYTSQKDLFRNVRSLIKAKLNNDRLQKDGEVAQTIEPSLRPPIDNDSLLDKAGKYLCFFDGINPITKQRIASPENARYIISTIDSYIKDGIIPKALKSVSQLNISNQHVLYTCYLIHRALWGKKINREFITLVKCLMGQLSNTETETMYKKWSTQPKCYEMDFAYIVN